MTGPAVDPWGAGDQTVWELRLYVAGQTERSLRAHINLKRIVEQTLPGRCRIEVIDLQTQPHLAEEHQIVVLPTLVRMAPLPLRRVVGDLSDAEKTLAGLALIPRPDLKAG